jgi:hypothetical protein
MSRLRPFVERHRACRTVAEDGEMRSAFTRVG